MAGSSLGLSTSFSDITGALGDIFGGTTDINVGVSGTATRQGTQTERLNISQEGIQKIIEDLLASDQGLASIFAGEQNAGIFNSSVAAQAAGDLAANIVGEIAKLTSEKVTTTDETTTQESTQRQEQSSGGILGAIGDLFGF